MATFLGGGVQKRNLSALRLAHRARLKAKSRFAAVNADYTSLLCTQTITLADVTQLLLRKQRYANYDRHHTKLVASIARFRKRKRALTARKRNSVLAEIHGERMAAITLHSKLSAAGYQLHKGYEGGGAGIDQIWANFDPAVAPIPVNGVVLVVDAKGGSAQITATRVYRGKIGVNGALPQGCQQLDRNWVYVDAAKLAINGQTAQSRAAGTVIVNALTAGAGPPRVLGLCVSDGDLLTSAQYKRKAWLTNRTVGKGTIPQLAAVGGNFSVLRYV